MSVPKIAHGDLIARYDGFLLDAYGVLVDGSGPLPHAADFLGALTQAGKAWVVLSNDASRLPWTAAERYRGFGLPLSAERIVTSGSLLGPHFERAGLRGRACIVLGPDESRAMVVAAGGRLVEAQDDAVEVLVICDDAGYPFLPTIEAAISSLLRRLDRGETVDLVLPNPDLIYPKAPGEVGLTSGSVAMLVEAALIVRFGAAAPRFVALGKPHPPIFEAGCRSLGLPRERVVMIGDQLGTDIQGASRFGMDSVLVTTGVGRVLDAEVTPTYIMPALGPVSL